MKQHYLSLLFLLGAILGPMQIGKAQFMPLVSWKFTDGQVENELTVKVREHNENLISIERNGIIIHIANLNKEDLSRNSFDLLTGSTKPTDLKIIYQIKAGQPHVKSHESIGQPEGLSLNQKRFNLINLANIESIQSALISITVVNGVGTKVGEPFDIPIRILPIPKNEALEVCSQKITSGEKLTCYTDYLKVVSGQQRIEVERQITELSTQKKQLEAIVFTLQKEGGRNNQFRIVPTLTRDWRKEDFNLSYQGPVKKVGADNWLVRSTGHHAKVDIKHKDWPAFTKAVSILYFPNTNKSKDDIATSKEKDTNVEEVDSLEPGGEIVSPFDSIPDTLDIVVPTVPITAIDSLWRDSIAPLIDFSQPIAILQPSDHLSKQLNHYLLVGSDPIKKTYSYAILFRLWIIPLLLLLIIPIRKLTRGRKKKEKEKPTSNAVLKPDTLEKTPSESTTEEANTNEELFIEIEEVEKIYTEGQAERLSVSQLMAHDSYLPIDLKECWEDTATERVFFRKESIKDIAEMLRNFNAYSGDRADMEQLPEIGGFILGHVYDSEEGSFDLSIEQFIPITPESNNRYTVKFGDRAWVELDDALKQFRGLKLVGWFHTHPGHGLFLSEADLREHRQLFRNRYQVALEIDPTTPKKDTAFFTWTKEKDLNNQSDRQSAWWSFTDLEAAAS